jgi:hypothetical protein
MTRYEQWYKRRLKYMKRNQRWRNGLPRLRAATLPPLNPSSYSHVRPAGMLPVCVQPPPRISAKLLKLQRRRPTSYERQFFDQIDGEGYADPPHVRFVEGIYTPGDGHFDVATCKFHLRSVTVRTKCLLRLSGTERSSIRAWTYWKKLGFWPVWDPRGRQPVDPDPLGEDDVWSR